MNTRLVAAVEALIHSATGDPAQITSSAAAGGGCINDARRIQLADGREFFLKSNPHPLPRLFECEAEALAELHRINVIRVPKPLATGGGEGIPSFIVMEYIHHSPSHTNSRSLQRTLGQQFALLHKNSSSAKFGFHHDNYLGSTTQPNHWTKDWVEFWRIHRLEHQLRLAQQNGYADHALLDAGNRLLDRLGEFIAEPNDPPSLLHGDLWSGNYLADAQGNPVLIDPASYYGRREADLAMTMLFGGFTEDFYTAYNETWPLETSGAEARFDIYKLYHLLNHLNLFGRSYYAGCLSIMRRYAG